MTGPQGIIDLLEQAINDVAAIEAPNEKNNENNKPMKIEIALSDSPVAVISEENYKGLVPINSFDDIEIPYGETDLDLGISVSIPEGYCAEIVPNLPNKLICLNPQRAITNTFNISIEIYNLSPKKNPITIEGNVTIAYLKLVRLISSDVVLVN